MPSHTFQITGKNAVVTGSNSGIGLAIATTMAQAGINVAINSFTDRKEDHQLAQSLSDKHGVKVVYIKADLSKPDECAHLIHEAERQLGSVDILCNNAGVQHVAPIEEFGAENWERTIAVDLSSAMHCTAAALPIMRKNRNEVMEQVFFIRLPSKDFVLPEQLAAAVMFLCADSSAQIRGIALSIDGGGAAY